MRNVPQIGQDALQQPLTVADVARHVSRFPSPCYVQVRVKREVLCGRVIEVGSPSSVRDYFKVETAIGQQWVSGWNARKCSGDGRCLCEGAAGSQAERSDASDRRRPSPLGNTGVTVVGAA